MLCLCERHKLAETERREAEKQQMLLPLHLLFAAQSEQTGLHERRDSPSTAGKRKTPTLFMLRGETLHQLQGHGGTHRGTGPAGWGPAKWPTGLAAGAPTPGPPSSVRHANCPRCRHLLCGSPPGSQTAGRGERMSGWRANKPLLQICLQALRLNSGGRQSLNPGAKPALSHTWYSFNMQLFCGKFYDFTFFFSCRPGKVTTCEKNSVFFNSNYWQQVFRKLQLFKCYNTNKTSTL